MWDSGRRDADCPSARQTSSTATDCHTQQGFFLQERGQGEHLTPTEVPHVTLQGSAFKTAAPVSTGVTSAPGLIILDSSRGMMGLDPSGTWGAARPARKTPALERGSELFPSNVSSLHHHGGCAAICSHQSQFRWIQSIRGCLQGISVYQTQKDVVLVLVKLHPMRILKAGNCNRWCGGA